MVPNEMNKVYFFRNNFLVEKEKSSHHELE